MFARVKGLLNTWLLVELLKGLWLTGGYFFARKVTVQFRREDAAGPAFPRPACASPLSER
jgi:NADH-quinone oxidoreductase subunit I